VGKESLIPGPGWGEKTTPGHGFPVGGLHPPHIFQGVSVIPMSLSEGDLLWLEPENEWERAWLLGCPEEWSLERMWCEWRKVDAARLVGAA
jgi:hypothetical protein